MDNLTKERWLRIPFELRSRSQWCLAGEDKRPLKFNGLAASVTDPTTWTDFETACQFALERKCDIGYMQTADDPFTCIDIDVKDSSSPEALARYQSIIAQFDSYTEYSRSGRGYHVWVKGKTGKGRRRDGIEVYSQERFMICTGNVFHNRPIAEHQILLSNLLSQLSPEAATIDELWGDDTPDWSVASAATEDNGELGRLFKGDWEGWYPSQSEADLALVKLILPLTDSPRVCWLTFCLSKLGKREKAKRLDYARSTIASAMQHLVNDREAVRHGAAMAEGLFHKQSTNDSTSKGPASTLLRRLNINWEQYDDVEVPDIAEGLIADEEVTLLGGHGGVGKGFLALQAACAVALGEKFLNCPTRQSRVLYYSAEDGRKRLTRRIRRVLEMFEYSPELLRQNLCVLDASEVDPLYGESQETSVDGKRFVKTNGARIDFDNLRSMVEEFDPQLVIVDGASDTFDGNEIARREVRAFIKLLRQVHPHRNIAVLLIVHIDRASARGHSSNDDGYAGSAQWHNSCRRRLFLHHQVKKERDDDGEETVVSEKFVLRIMKNQDGPPAPDMELLRGEYGLWQLGVEFGGAFAPQTGTDYAATIVRLIGEYYGREQYMSASLAPQATTGVYETLKGDPEFPRGLSRKKTSSIIRDLKRDGVLVEEPYKRPNRTSGERWMVMRDPNQPFAQGAQSATG